MVTGGVDAGAHLELHCRPAAQDRVEGCDRSVPHPSPAYILLGLPGSMAAAYDTRVRLEECKKRRDRIEITVGSKYRTTLPYSCTTTHTKTDFIQLCDSIRATTWPYSVVYVYAFVER